MESATKSHQRGNDITRFMQSASSNLFSLFDLNSIKSSNASKTTTSTVSHHLRFSPDSSSSSSSTIRVPLLFGDAPTPPPLPQPSSQPLPSVLALSAASLPFTSSLQSSQSDSLSSTPASSSEIKGMSSGSGFPSTVRIAGLNSDAKGGGPAFVGQVFSMCDLSGTGLMAVSTRIDIPFLSKRIPDWIKKVFSKVIKNENNGPVFRFFMDLGDAVTYVKRLNIPTGVVGACRLDLAYEHFKEKPHMFQFVPNEKQVKAANKLLKELPKNNGRKKVDGVPVFTAQNLDIAIATSDGIKWYTPYFFDKNMLDNILEESIDQHFHTLIHSRHVQRRRDVIDDNFTAEVVEENGESIWEPPEVQEVLEEMGNPGIPLSVISKAAEMQLLYTVDKVLLGNRWLRKATGIQPKFPYMVDSFEERSAASFLRAADSTSTATISDTGCDGNDRQWQLGSSELDLKERNKCSHAQSKSNWDFRFPFGDWLSNPWLKEHKKTQTKSDTRFEDLGRDYMNQVPQLNPLLPKITMVGISTGEAGQMNRSSLKKTMEDLTRELEHTGQETNGSSSELKHEDRDPLFVANVGDYYSSIAKTGSARWVRGRNN